MENASSKTGGENTAGVEGQATCAPVGAPRALWDDLYEKVSEQASHLTIPVALTALPLGEGTSRSIFLASPLTTFLGHPHRESEKLPPQAEPLFVPYVCSAVTISLGMVLI